ncbi:hypothetical protein [Winogradskyella sp. R77965]|uniref:hypothetical protein n=1 Tax=Winogradskyella sp. R77965 TaxID=3093872 RepID=UPI0037DD59AB
MERLSNDINILRERARKEVNTFNAAIDKTIIRFFEYPSIAGFPYCILIIRNKENKLISMFRQWDTAYDMQRWNNSIYNLDRLRIISHKHELLESEIITLNAELNSLENHKLPKTISDTSVTVLDGSDFELMIQSKIICKNYKWRVATDDIDLFIPLIEQIKEFHLKKNKKYA